MDKKLTNEKIFKINPFKERISHSNLRACVGNNSGISANSRDCTIMNGYKETVDLLYSNIIKLKSNIDVVVYPLIFCCRHSIELSLKIILKNLKIIYLNKVKENKNNSLISKIDSLLKVHNIKDLYEYIRDFPAFQSEIKDNLKKFKNLEDCIKDYYFDCDSDSFRYTFKKNHSDINLSDIQLVDIGVLYWKYKKLIKFLDWFINNFCFWLFNEYKITYTANLGRSKIESLSIDLSGILNLTKEEFKKKKTKLCKKYSISASEFDKACKIIEKHYAFSLNAGIENKFHNLTEEVFEKLGKVYEMYLKKIQAEEQISTRPMAIDITELEKYSPLSSKYFEYCLSIEKSLTVEEKLVLRTFSEYSTFCIDGNYMCEDIDFLFSTFEKENEEFIFDGEIGGLVSSGKLKKALKECGQATYLKWYNKYIPDIKR